MKINKIDLIVYAFLGLITALLSCGNNENESQYQSDKGNVQDSNARNGTQENAPETIGLKILADTLNIDTSSSMEVATKNLRDFEKEKIEKTKKLDNGISIKWLIDQKGRPIRNGEMVLIEYRLSLPDGKIVAGNNPKMPFMPFVVGYNLQTLGWDIAMQELSIGDFAKIELPSSFAYGVKGIKDIIPPNSKVWLFVKVYSYIEPGIDQNGVKSWLVKEGLKASQVSSENAEYTLQMSISSKSSSNIVNTYFNNAPLKYSKGQKNLLPGLKRIVETSRKGNRYLVLLAPEKGFGPNGYGDKISKSDTILVNLEIEDVRGN